MLSKLSKTLKEKVAHSSTTVRQRKKAEWCFQGRGRRGGEEGRGCEDGLLTMVVAQH